MKNKIIFIHGMFQNAKSWDKWVTYFIARGYACIAQSWPLHEGEPRIVRKNTPKGLGDLRLEEVMRKYEDIIRVNDPEAILIGHSVGGLIVQSLVNKGLGSAGVCISSVAPNKMLAFDWDFFRNSVSIVNPLKGDEPFYVTFDGFYDNFCNTLSKEDATIAYKETATNDSRNVLRDCMMEPGHIEIEKTNKPLLFIGAEKDRIIPPELNEKNAKAYREGLAEFVKFPNRSHYICNEPGWEEIAEHTLQWIVKQNVPVGV